MTRTVSKHFGDVRVVVTCYTLRDIPVVEDRQESRTRTSVSYYVDPVALVNMPPTVRSAFMGATCKTPEQLERQVERLHRALQQHA